MLDKWMEKLMLSAASAYMPRIESLRETRKVELQKMKEQVRTTPQEVEQWFDKEIAKLESMDVSDIMNNLR